MEKLINVKLLDDIISDKFVSLSLGLCLFEFILIKPIDNNAYIKYCLQITNNKYIFEFRQKKLTLNNEYNNNNGSLSKEKINLYLNTIIKIFNLFSEHISYKIYLNINYEYLDDYINDINDNLLLFDISNDYKIQNIINYTKQNNIKPNVDKSFVNCNNLKIVNTDNIDYYLNKYLNNNFYNFENKNYKNNLPIVCFNKKYIIDGNYRYFEKYMKNPKSKIEIINLFNTNDVNNILDYLYLLNNNNNNNVMINDSLKLIKNMNYKLNDDNFDNDNFDNNDIYNKYNDNSDYFNKIGGNFNKKNIIDNVKNLLYNNVLKVKYL